MANGRSIKRKMAKENPMPNKEVSPETPKSPQSYDELYAQVAGGKQKQVSPAKKKQIEMVNATLTDMLYNPGQSQQVQKMLTNGPPEITIPAVVNAVFNKFEDMAREKQGEMPMDIKLVAGIHLFSEVLELAEAKGVLPPDYPEEKIQPLLKECMQKYIQRGLKDGSIDPIELQQRIEPLLTGEEKEIGMSFARAMGTPEQLQGVQASEAMFRKRTMPLEVENKRLKEQTKQMQGALQGISEKPQGGM